MPFYTVDGRPVPAVTAAQMAEVDRLAEEAFGIGLIQMMEHAGRSLAAQALELLGGPRGRVVVLAGAGGNGGGGLCAARHLANRGVSVALLLDRPPEAFQGAARRHLDPLRAMGLIP